MGGRWISWSTSRAEKRPGHAGRCTPSACSRAKKIRLGIFFFCRCAPMRGGRLHRNPAELERFLAEQLQNDCRKTAEVPHNLQRVPEGRSQESRHARKALVSSLVHPRHPLPACLESGRRESAWAARVRRACALAVRENPMDLDALVSGEVPECERPAPAAWRSHLKRLVRSRAWPPPARSDVTAAAAVLKANRRRLPCCQQPPRSSRLRRGWPASAGVSAGESAADAAISCARRAPAIESTGQLRTRRTPHRGQPAQSPPSERCQCRRSSRAVCFSIVGQDCGTAAARCSICRTAVQATAATRSCTSATRCNSATLRPGNSATFQPGEKRFCPQRVRARPGPCADDLWHAGYSSFPPEFPRRSPSRINFLGNPVAPP